MSEGRSSLWLSADGRLRELPAAPSANHPAFGPRVRVRADVELVATDTKGGSLRRLTRQQGSNDYPACSPDGGLVAFFSTTTSGKASGLYLTPVARPWLAQKISTDVGEALRWERTLAP